MVTATGSNVSLTVVRPGCPTRRFSIPRGSRLGERLSLAGISTHRSAVRVGASVADLDAPVEKDEQVLISPQIVGA